MGSIRAAINSAIKEDVVSPYRWLEVCPVLGWHGSATSSVAEVGCRYTAPGRLRSFSASSCHSSAGTTPPPDVVPWSQCFTRRGTESKNARGVVRDPASSDQVLHPRFRVCLSFYPCRVKTPVCDGNVLTDGKEKIPLLTQLSVGSESHLHPPRPNPFPRQGPRQLSRVKR